MRPDCPTCSQSPHYCSDSRTIHPKGKFFRKSDHRWISRFLCTLCKKGFSNATLQAAFGQKKRKVNSTLKQLLCAGVSQRRCAKILNIHRTTVARKLVFLGLQSKEILKTKNDFSEKITEVEFDDLETFEHTKMKPVSVIQVVEAKSRRILGLRVAKMPAKGLLAKKSLKKYGPREDERGKVRRELFQELQSLIHPKAVIKSDSSPHYPQDVKEFFPDATHITYLSRKPLNTGQGELKKGPFDPIFSINHTFAMNRYSLARLIRKTWCTTKKPENLSHHLHCYALFHNEELKKKA